MSSTEISAVDQNELNAMLAVLQGSGPSTASDDTIKVPFLKVQYDPDAPLRGGFHMMVSDTPVYFKGGSVKVRCLAQHYQYRETDPDTYKIVNKSILMDDMRKREPIDMKGGIRCGRPDAKSLAQLDDDTQRMWRKKVKGYRILRGVVSGTGEDANGDSVEIENQPFQMYLSGMNFMPFSNSIEKVLQTQRKNLHDVWVDLDTRKDGKAFIIDFSVSKDSAIMNTDTIETMRVFVDMAKQENDRVKAEHKKAFDEMSSMDLAMDAMNSVADLDADLV